MTPGPAWPLPARHVARPELVDRVLSGRRAVALVAPGGYGKTALAAESAHRHTGPVVAVRCTETTTREGLWRRLARAAGVVGLTDLARAMAEEAGPDDVLDAIDRACARPEPRVLVVLDEVDLLSDEAAAWVDDLAQHLPPGLGLVLLGRRLPGVLAAVGRLEVIGPDDLAFGEREVRALGAGPHEAVDIVRRTEGWPALATMALDGGGAGEPGRVSLAALLLDRMAGLSAADRAALAHAAHLPMLHPLVDAALGAPGLAARSLRAGLPVVVGDDGRWRMAGPVTDHLRSVGPVPPDVAARVAAAYDDLGAPVAGARLLAATGQPAAAAAAISCWASTVVEGDEADAAVTLIDSLPDPVVEERPACLLVAARLHHRLGQPARRRAALDRARAIDVTQGALQREIDAEWAYAVAMADDHARSVPVARAVLAAAAPDETRARSRAMAALGTALGRPLDPATSATARQATETAAQLMVDLGEPAQAAEALLMLAHNQLFQEGRWDEAVVVARRAMALVPGRTRLRARMAVFLADVLVGAGRYAEARPVLDEAAWLTDAVGSREQRGHLAWVTMELASRHRDGAGVAAAVATVERNRGEWYDRRTSGALFHCDAVMAAARVDLDLARSQWEALQVHPATTRGMLDVARAALDVRGSARDTLAALSPERVPDLPPRLRWWAALLRAVAHHRSGDAAGCNREVELLRRELAVLGAPELPASVEPDLWAEVGGVVSPSPRSLRVRALGGFALHDERGAVAVPSGHVRRLAALVAVSGEVDVDAAVEVLWPDEPAGAGRRRLRNVVLRLRQACPGLIERDGDRLVRCADVHVDVVEFERLARDALASGIEGVDVGLARAAVRHYTGHLLAGATEDGWCAAQRERLRLEYVDLVDVLIDAAIADDDIDEALRLTERAIDADPLEERRYLTAIALLLDRGRVSAARGILERVDALHRELDLPAGRAVEALRTRVAEGR